MCDWRHSFATVRQSWYDCPTLFVVKKDDRVVKTLSFAVTCWKPASSGLFFAWPRWQGQSAINGEDDGRLRKSISRIGGCGALTKRWAVHGTKTRSSHVSRNGLPEKREISSRMCCDGEPLLEARHAALSSIETTPAVMRWRGSASSGSAPISAMGAAARSPVNLLVNAGFNCCRAQGSEKWMPVCWRDEVRPATGIPYWHYRSGQTGSSSADLQFCHDFLLYRTSLMAKIAGQRDDNQVNPLFPNVSNSIAWHMPSL
ncbi:hypothetical protein PCO31110_00996 [Pandoraea communis]|uniref:Uncharacterized protein n=1 Tax=Pandoraea communis TaxID=2508297 RepID=A0A5E4SX34_9BURK|nr:hypothetical protein PCO31110_00996 [Pandoraea communis]